MGLEPVISGLPDIHRWSVGRRASHAGSRLSPARRQRVRPGRTIHQGPSAAAPSWRSSCRPRPMRVLGPARTPPRAEPRRSEPSWAERGQAESGRAELLSGGPRGDRRMGHARGAPGSSTRWRSAADCGWCPCPPSWPPGSPGARPSVPPPLTSASRAAGAQASSSPVYLANARPDARADEPLRPRAQAAGRRTGGLVDLYSAGRR